MFSNVIIYYVFRLVNAMAAKKCEIHLGEVFLQLFSIGLDFTSNSRYIVSPIVNLGEIIDSGHGFPPNPAIV